MKVFFRIAFVLYALFLAFCAYAVMDDPPWYTGPRDGVGSGMFGFMAEFAAGFPWSFAMFPIHATCERLRNAGICPQLESDHGFAVLCAIAAAVNLLALGVLGQWWKIVRWRKRAPPPLG